MRQQEVERATEQLSAIEDRQQKLIIKAPFDGIVADVAVANNEAANQENKRSAEAGMKPTKGTYRLLLSLKKPLATSNAIRGKVHLYGEKESGAARLLRRVAAVLIRETSF